MNLHEECLLKYLLNSISIVNTTDVLQRYNRLLEKKSLFKRVANHPHINYTYNR